jgi:hypothetical protein
MTAEEEFAKWWTVRLPYEEERRVLATGEPGKFVAQLAYVAGYYAGQSEAAARCVEICQSYGGDAWLCAAAIKKEYGLE